jgi:hypothetical protein
LKWSVDTDLIVHEGIPCTAEEIIKEIFQEMEKLPPTQKTCDNDSDDENNDTVSDEHVMPPPNHEDALQCVS